MEEDEGQGFKKCKVWEEWREDEKRGKRHASAEKEGAGDLSPRALSPETTTSGTQRPLRGKTASHGHRLGWRVSLPLLD